MRLTGSVIARVLIVVIGGFVLFQLLPLVWLELTGRDGCPNFGPVPVCLIVAVCYTLMALAAIAGPRRLTVVFAVGWIPVFLLALTGSTFELLGKDACPKNSGGIPLCYFSLAMACVLVVLYYVARRPGDAPS